MQMGLARPGGVDDRGDRQHDRRRKEALAAPERTFAIATSQIGQGAWTRSSIRG